MPRGTAFFHTTGEIRVSSQRAMLLSARKEPGKYTKGAVLGAHFQALLRIVPPPLALALAMTEPEEKAVPGMRAS